ncbi:MAG: hypothetical protein HYS13_13555 [Planctomycetia bacterium]|nr:hypothetical protein [Planctomycetia bacterium]
MRVPAAAALLFFASALARAEEKPAAVDFAKQVRPILAEHCFRCHGPKEQKNGLRLDRRDDALRGGESKEPAIVPGNPDKSLAVIYIRGDDPEVMMPPEGERVPKEKLELLVRWIREGASWPDEAPDKAPSTGEKR